MYRHAHAYKLTAAVFIFFPQWMPCLRLEMMCTWRQRSLRSARRLMPTGMLQHILIRRVMDSIDSDHRGGTLKSRYVFRIHSSLLDKVTLLIVLSRGVFRRPFMVSRQLLSECDESIRISPCQRQPYLWTRGSEAALCFHFFACIASCVFRLLRRRSKAHVQHGPILLRTVGPCDAANCRPPKRQRCS